MVKSTVRLSYSSTPYSGANRYTNRLFSSRKTAARPSTTLISRTRILLILKTTALTNSIQTSTRVS